MLYIIPSSQFVPCEPYGFSQFKRLSYYIEIYRSWFWLQFEATMLSHALIYMPQSSYVRPSLHLRTQGKVAELRFELTSGGKKDKNHSAKKIALKKIVANMTMSNNDMVALFPDVVACMQIQSLEIKKMYEIWDE